MVGSMVGPKHMNRAGYYDHAHHWHDATSLTAEGDRVLPETVPHEWLATHRVGCECAPCMRYPEKILRDLKAVARRRRT